MHPASACCSVTPPTLRQATAVPDKGAQRGGRLPQPVRTPLSICYTCICRTAQPRGTLPMVYEKELAFIA